MSRLDFCVHCPHSVDDEGLKCRKAYSVHVWLRIRDGDCPLGHFKGPQMGGLRILTPEEHERIMALIASGGCGCGCGGIV